MLYLMKVIVIHRESFQGAQELQWRAEDSYRRKVRTFLPTVAGLFSADADDAMALRFSQHSISHVLAFSDRPFCKKGS